MSARRIGVLLGAIVAATPLSLGSQQGRQEDLGGAWHADWTPFAAIADLARTPLAVPRASSLLLLPAPRVGRAWSMGDPSGTVRDARERWGTGLLGATAASGSYRRPLDAERSSLGRLAMMGWQPLGDRAGATGRVVIDQWSDGPSSSGNAVWPYATSPFVVTDSTAPDMRAQRARLEGAIGWDVRGWLAGISAGYEAQDLRSESTPFPRLGRLGAPALAAGVGRALWGVDVSAYARWQQADETLTLVPLITGGTVWQLEGYAEPDRRAVSGVPYLRRSDRQARAWGASTSGSLLSTRWVLGAEVGSRNERYTSQRSATPPTDAWDADGLRVLAALQRGAWRERVLVTARGEYASLDGSGRRNDLPGDVFRAEESRWRGTVDVRTAVPKNGGSPWRAALALSTGRESRTRADFTSSRQVVTEAWTPGMAAEVARRLSSGTDVALGAGVAASAVSARVPGAASAGPVYQRLVAPAIAYEASPSRALGGDVTVRQRIGAGRAAWVNAGFEQRTPTGVGAPLRPEGSRSAWRVAAGAMLLP